MFKSGSLSAEQAMQLLASDGGSGAMKSGEAAASMTSGDDKANDPKRKHDILTPSKDSEAASPAPKEPKLTLLDTRI